MSKATAILKSQNSRGCTFSGFDIPEYFHYCRLLTRNIKNAGHRLTRKVTRGWSLSQLLKSGVHPGQVAIPSQDYYKNTNILK